MLVDKFAYLMLTGRPLSVQEAKQKPPWFNLTFSLGDFFNIPLGFVEGGMMAIKAKVSNELCAKNSKTSRQSFILMAA